MEKGRSRNQLAWLAWLLCILACPAWSEGVAEFNVSQTAVRLPNITAYVDILDKNGQPATGVKANIAATLDGHRLPLTDLKSFDENGEGVAYFFLVDISKSIRPAQFNQMREALYTWIDGLRSEDRVAVATFGEDYHLLVDFTGDKQAAKSALEPLRPSDAKTLLHLALHRAFDLSRRNDKDLPTRRVVVVLTDGKDEGSGITVEDLRPQIQASHLPIYAIGYSNLPGEEKQYYLDVLHRLASLSGGLFREATSASLAQDYAEMNGSIRRVFVARFSCGGCRLSDKTYPMEIDLTSGSVAVSDKINVGVEWVPWWRRIPGWAYALAIAVLAGILLLVFALSRKEPSAETQAPILEPPVILAPTRPTPVVGLPVKLATVKGKDVGQVHEVNLVDRAHIGRTRDCDVVLPDTEVSGRHCDLVFANGHVMIHDLGSTNGTLVNGARVVKQVRLESGDLICVGRTELRIVFCAQRGSPVGPDQLPSTPGTNTSMMTERNDMAARTPEIAAHDELASGAFQAGSVPTTSGKAIASLVLGFFFWVFPAAVLAIVLGHLSRGEIRRNNGRLKGAGMALAGLIMGYCGVAIIPIGIIAISTLLPARIAANEAAAVSALRALNKAEIAYKSMYPRAGFTCSLAQLGPSSTASLSSAAAGLVDLNLALGTKSGYAFRSGTCNTESGVTVDYQWVALPQIPGTTGQRYFCTDVSGIISFSTISGNDCRMHGTPL